MVIQREATVSRGKCYSRGNKLVLQGKVFVLCFQGENEITFKGKSNPSTS